MKRFTCNAISYILAMAIAAMGTLLVVCAYYIGELKTRLEYLEALPMAYVEAPELNKHGMTKQEQAKVMKSLLGEK